MKVNSEINKFLDEVSKASIEYSNNKEENRKYIRRLLKLFDTALSEEERIYVLSYLLYNIYFKNVVFDDDNMLRANNIKLRTITFIFILCCAFMVLTALLFHANPDLNKFVSETAKMLVFIINL